MMNYRHYIITIVLLVASAMSFAQTSDTDCIVERTQTSGGFWRYDFHYTTADIDGQTPIVLSGAIFMSQDVHDKKITSPGCALMNHYTITREADAPTSVTGFMTLEGFIASSTSNCIIIESDGIGFGLTKDRKQPYLLGRISARNSIDAFIAGRKLLEAEGYTFGSMVFNLGYSQGGHTGMWVSRLVEEGYRSDELPGIDYSILGGGPYDIYSHYKYLLETGKSSYPVALPLILYGLVAEGSVVTVPEVFSPQMAAKLPEWFDTKKYETVEINDSIYANFGDSIGDYVPMSQITTADFLDSTSTLVQGKLIPKMKEHSLVYDDWTPAKTKEIMLVHSPNDEVVPYLNLESMEAFLKKQGYTNYTIRNDIESKHTETGTGYALLVASELYKYTTDIQTVRNNGTNTDQRIFRINGMQVPYSGTLEEAVKGLAPGIYIIGRKAVVVK